MLPSFHRSYICPLRKDYSILLTLDRPHEFLSALNETFEKLSESSEYRPLCSGPAHWIPACAGMTGYGLHRGSTRPKAGFQTASEHFYNGFIFIAAASV